MKLLKSIPPGLLGRGAALVIALLGRTLRWRFVGHEDPDLRSLIRTPSVFVFWHGRQLVFPCAVKFYRRELGVGPVAVLISQHRDGRIIAEAIKSFGLDSIAGSSSRGGSAALLALEDRAKEGSHIAITPDGPRGPARAMKVGAVVLAQRLGAPLIPVCLSASRYWQVGSWDRMMVPKPGARVEVHIGKPVWIPPEADREEIDRLVGVAEESLNQLTDFADQAVLDSKDKGRR